MQAPGLAQDPITASKPTLHSLLPQPRNAGIYVVAHRGAHNGIPENSLPAYEKAIELGCDFVEIDVRTTKDGELISVHNSRIDRYVTNDSGKVSAKTLAELKKLDIGARIGAKWTGTRIPTVEEILQLCKGRIGIYLDLKDVAIPQLYALIKKYKMENDVLWYVGYDEENTIREIRTLCPACLLMPDPGKQKTLSRHYV